MAAKVKVRRTARTADRHELYELSVQCPEADVRFINRVYKRTWGKEPESLMEDFCGTAMLCAEWIGSRPGRTAVGVDLDADVLASGRERHLVPLGEDAQRVRLLQQDVCEVTRPKVHVRVGFNFSYCIFHERKDLLRYFRAARASMKREGLFFIDLHGGPEAASVLEEKKKVDGFTYVWDQFNPIDHHTVCHIHFRFSDGTRIEKAFTYDWRLWTMPELRDVLLEAGFSEAECYWEGTTDDGEGNGIFRRTRKATNDPSWIAYLVARP